MSFPRNGKLPTRGRFGGPGGKRACFFLLLNNKEINIKILQGGAIKITLESQLRAEDTQNKINRNYLSFESEHFAQI